MKLSLAIGLALAFGCATTSKQQTRLAQNDDGKETKCRLIGSQYDYDAHSLVRDETKTLGPSKVIWLNPPTTTIIRTVDGLFYRCDGRL